MKKVKDTSINSTKTEAKKLTRTNEKRDQRAGRTSATPTPEPATPDFKAGKDL